MVGRGTVQVVPSHCAKHVSLVAMVASAPPASFWRLMVSPPVFLMSKSTLVQSASGGSSKFSLPDDSASTSSQVPVSSVPVGVPGMRVSVTAASPIAIVCAMISF